MPTVWTVGEVQSLVGRHGLIFGMNISFIVLKKNVEII